MFASVLECFFLNLDNWFVLMRVWRNGNKFIPYYLTMLIKNLRLSFNVSSLPLSLSLTHYDENRWLNEIINILRRCVFVTFCYHPLISVSLLNLCMYLFIYHAMKWTKSIICQATTKKTIHLILYKTFHCSFDIKFYFYF